ncbi:hypothetical protein C484_15103 [Natrialba taiwanensis DSM 12281]|uniref:Uncharacterized protein n=1 Tax=Natrialba taiwanensis DSM 12281 TaxID=1230458 RepID=L9ZTQ0_9EURY|nr:hypothetical protein C484_15103 [Natrialba taiwanensis DSM 12281]
MPTHASIIELENRDVQHARELASIWDEVRAEFDQHGAALRNAYTVLGEQDFLRFSRPETEGPRSNRR